MNSWLLWEPKIGELEGSKVAWDPIEAWLDFGEMRVEVTQHVRLISSMKMIINDGKRSENFTQAVAMRDISDTSVLRRIRMIQLVALADCSKVKMVFTCHGRAFRENMVGKGKGTKKSECTATEKTSSKKNNWLTPCLGKGPDEESN